MIRKRQVHKEPAVFVMYIIMVRILPNTNDIYDE